MAPQGGSRRSHGGEEKETDNEETGGEEKETDNEEGLFVDIETNKTTENSEILNEHTKALGELKYSDNQEKERATGIREQAWEGRETDKKETANEDTETACSEKESHNENIADERKIDIAATDTPSEEKETVLKGSINAVREAEAVNENREAESEIFDEEREEASGEKRTAGEKTENEEISKCNEIEVTEERETGSEEIETPDCVKETSCEIRERDMEKSGVLFDGIKAHIVRQYEEGETEHNQTVSEEIRKSSKDCEKGEVMNEGTASEKREETSEEMWLKKEQMRIEKTTNTKIHEAIDADRAKTLGEEAPNSDPTMLRETVHLGVSDPSLQYETSLIGLDHQSQEQQSCEIFIDSINGQSLSELQFQHTDFISQEQGNLSHIKDILIPSHLRKPAGLQRAIYYGGKAAAVIDQSIPSHSPLYQDQEDFPLEVHGWSEDTRASPDGSKINETPRRDVMPEGDGDSDGLCGSIDGISFQKTTGDFLKEIAECCSQMRTDSSSQETVISSQTAGNLPFEDLSHVLDKDRMVTVSELRDDTDNMKDTWGSNNMAILLTREHNDMDPYPSPHWGVRSSSLKLDSHPEGSIQGGRVRNLTPPCENRESFPAPLTKASQPTLRENMSMDPTIGQKDGDNSTVFIDRVAGNAAPEKEFHFGPVQFFNPILLLGQSPEEPGFYNDGRIAQHLRVNKKEDSVRLPPKQTIGVSQSGSVSGELESSHSSLVYSKVDDMATGNQPSAQPFTPVWLAPRRSRPESDSDRASRVRDSQDPEISPKLTDNSLVRRATIRHKKSTRQVPGEAGKRQTTMISSTLAQENSTEPRRSDLQKTHSHLAGTKVQSSGSSQTKSLFRQQKFSEEAEKIFAESEHPRTKSFMEKLVEVEEESTGKEEVSRSSESVTLRQKHAPNISDALRSLHRRRSKLIHSSSLLYQEYSDVALNQEIQRQDSPVEERDPGSPRLRRRALSSQDSYLQRLSISSADSLWQDIPVIRGSSVLLSMTREEQKLQEAKFELIMSEVLYLRSLNIAVDHFQRSTELQEVLSIQDRQWLFSRLSEVRDASSDFLFDLEEKFETDMYNFQVCNVVLSHVPDIRRVYLPYVTNQSYQEKTFQRLRSDNPRFQLVLGRLESDPVCQRLSLKSFLILPFQRITRLQLLLQNILKRSVPGSSEELQATEAHNALEKLIKDCNENVQIMKDTEELILLNQKIQFECKIFPLISQSRRQIKHGEVTSLEFNSLSFKWKVTTRPVYLHLFNDCLMLSRLREGGRFVVFDYARASDVRVERCEMKLHGSQKNIFRLFLRDSAAGLRETASVGRESAQDGRDTEYILRTETQSQKLRWISALSPLKEETDFLKDHGLSQMQCLKSYKSRENDELSLDKADIVMVTQRSEDGWLCGVRLSDMQSGWFPQSNVQPISRNACLRNLQEEQRLQTARAKLQPSSAK
ncbi:hypothetical protein FKM82_014745 [Ascaphus truei]